MMFSLKEQPAMVTADANGIGQGIAQTLLLADLDATAGRKLSDGIAADVP